MKFDLFVSFLCPTYTSLRRGGEAGERRKGERSEGQIEERGSKRGKGDREKRGTQKRGHGDGERKEGKGCERERDRE